MFENTPIEQLRAEVLAFQNSQQATADSVPLPPGAPPGMPPEAQEKLFENWTAYIYARPAQTWNPEEKAAIRFAANRVLKAL